MLADYHRSIQQHMLFFYANNAIQQKPAYKNLMRMMYYSRKP